jgi:hypothetical protein
MSRFCSRQVPCRMWARADGLLFEAAAWRQGKQAMSPVAGIGVWKYARSCYLLHSSRSPPLPTPADAARPHAWCTMHNLPARKLATQAIHRQPITTRPASAWAACTMSSPSSSNPQLLNQEGCSALFFQHDMRTTCAPQASPSHNRPSGTKAAPLQLLGEKPRQLVHAASTSCPSRLTYATQDTCGMLPAGHTCVACGTQHLQCMEAVQPTAARVPHGRFCPTA